MLILDMKKVGLIFLNLSAKKKIRGGTLDQYASDGCLAYNS